MADLENAARRFLRSVPGVRSSYHRVRYLLWKQRVRMRSRSTMSGTIDPHRTLTVDPKDIRLACVWGPESYRKFEDRGKIEGGDWDEQVEEFESLDVYRGLREHFVEGRPWGETDYYQRVLGQVLGGNHKRGMTTREDVDKRCVELDQLYRRIKDEGYKPLDAVDGRSSSPTGHEDEVSVRIGRHGDLLFEDGRHRLTIAKILGVDRIPVKVTVRHSEWFDFLGEVHEYAAEHDGKVYNIVSHPDLDDVPALHGRERLDLIKDNLPVSGGTVLDIGCHWGYYCQRLEEMGFECVGIEVDPRAFYFAEKLRRAEGGAYELVNGSVFDYRGRSQFDVVLALYVFHHFTKTEDLHRQFIDLLGRMEMGALVFGCHNHDQPAMQSAYRNYEPDEFVEFILHHSNLTQARLIGTEGDRRNIYLLEA